jgi:hypothetical protein
VAGTRCQELRRPGGIENCHHGDRVHQQMSHRKEHHLPPGQLKWWQQAVIYQIAPMSFQDTNMRGDEGLILRLRK